MRISTRKIKSIHVFIGICVLWVIWIISFPSNQELIEGMDPISYIVMLLGSLIYPGIGYGIFLIIKKIKNRRKSKKDLEI